MVLASLSILVLAAGIAVAVLYDRSRQARRREVSLRGKLAAVERRAAQSEADQQLVTRFLREFPQLAHQMHAGANPRRIPGLLLVCLERIFEPTRAVVAIRRRPAAHDPDRSSRFTVAASHPRERGVRPGTEFRIGEGEMGFAAEVQRVMSRQDFENLTAQVKAALGQSAVPGIRPDLVAPLVFGKSTVAVLAVEGLGRWPVDPKDIIRLIAQVGALAAHSLQRYTQIKATASLDGLTGVLNKRFLSDHLAERIRQDPEGQRFSVFLFDLDNFKHYNDHNGHLAGDTLLRQLARLVQENVRKSAVFGRFGGEEFLLILPGATKEQALRAADNLRRLIAGFGFAAAVDQPLGCVSISGGVAEYPLDGREPGSLLRCADEALYLAKREGRNRVLGFCPTHLGLEGSEELAVGTRALLPAAEDAPTTSDDPELTPDDREAPESAESESSLG
jgi:diguanylate cyclase (GGDEF)-like protein